MDNRDRRGATRERSVRGAAVREASRHGDDDRALIDVGDEAIVVAAGLDAAVN